METKPGRVKGNVALQQKFIWLCIMSARKVAVSKHEITSGEMPQYLMIKAQLQARIQNGALKSGDKLPSERELCALFNTTRITVREARRSWRPAA